MALHDEDERREVTYEEARAVLEAQRETLSDLDTKAVRTVRITVVMIGIVLPVWKIDPTLFNRLLGTLSALSLVGALAGGLLTYSEADLFLGPNGEYLARLADDDFENRTWRRDLLHAFGNWIAENSEEIHFYGRLLFVSKLLLLTGIVLLGLAVLL